jgi:hypothetical protein
MILIAALATLNVYNGDPEGPDLENSIAIALSLVVILPNLKPTSKGVTSKGWRRFFSNNTAIALLFLGLIFTSTRHEDLAFTLDGDGSGFDSGAGGSDGGWTFAKLLGNIGLLLMWMGALIPLINYFRYRVFKSKIVESGKVTSFSEKHGDGHDKLVTRDAFVKDDLPHGKTTFGMWDVDNFVDPITKKKVNELNFDELGNMAPGGAPQFASRGIKNWLKVKDSLKDINEYVARGKKVPVKLAEGMTEEQTAVQKRQLDSQVWVTIKDDKKERFMIAGPHHDPETEKHAKIVKDKSKGDTCSACAGADRVYRTNPPTGSLSKDFWRKRQWKGLKHSKSCKNEAGKDKAPDWVRDDVDAAVTKPLEEWMQVCPKGMQFIKSLDLKANNLQSKKSDGTPWTDAERTSARKILRLNFFGVKDAIQGWVASKEACTGSSDGKGKPCIICARNKKKKVDDTAKPSSVVGHKLHDLRIPLKYETIFKEQGVDSLEILGMATVGDLQRIGLTLGHALTLTSALRGGGDGSLSRSYSAPVEGGITRDRDGSSYGFGSSA